MGHSGKATVPGDNPHSRRGQGLFLLVSGRRCGEGDVGGYYSRVNPLPPEPSRIFPDSSPRETTQLICTMTFGV